MSLVSLALPRRVGHDDLAERRGHLADEAGAIAAEPPLGVRVVDHVERLAGAQRQLVVVVRPAVPLDVVRKSLEKKDGGES